MGKRNIVEPVNLLFVLRFQRHHHAIAGCSGIAIIGLRCGDAGLTTRLAPGHECVELHHARRVEFLGEGIVEGTRLLEVIRAERYISDH